MNWADNTIIGLLTQIRDKPSGGSPSGDAAVTDVALGKTFDSATAGAGATGTSTKNATVPANAPILPGQVFVDYCVTLPVGIAIGSVNVASSGVTSISTSWLHALNTAFTAVVDVSAAGNAITNTDAILELIDTDWGSIGVAAGSKQIDLSGGTNAPATKDTAVVAGAGSSAYNLPFFLIGTENGRPKYQTQDTQEIIHWTGAEWSLAQTLGGQMYYKSTDNVATPDLATWVADADADPPGPTITLNNQYKLDLQNNGWTVTTN